MSRLPIETDTESAVIWSLPLAAVRRRIIFAVVLEMMSSAKPLRSMAGPSV